MKKFFLSPFFTGVFVIICLALYYGISYLCRLKFGVFDIEKVGATEFLTYLFYGIAGVVLICVSSDYWHTPRQNTYFALCFLWLVALLREMGVQHWLAVNDSTAIKINYFKNAAVPLYSKILVAFLVGVVIATAAYLLIKYFKQMVIGFFKLQPLYWTIATFAGMGILTQIADRLPAKYVKATGDHLSEPVRFALKIFEEGGESLLPLLFAIGLLQFHVILRKTTFQSADESTNTARDFV